MMSYSTRPPSRPGYYWLKRDNIEEVVEVWTDPNDRVTERVYYVHHCGSGTAVEVLTMQGARWAGPIPKPSA